MSIATYFKQKTEELKKKQFIAQFTPRYTLWFMVVITVLSIAVITNSAVQYFQAGWTLNQAVFNTFRDIGLSMPVAAIAVGLALNLMRMQKTEELKKAQVIALIAPPYIFWFTVVITVLSIAVLTNSVIQYFQEGWTLYQAVFSTFRGIGRHMPALAIVVALALTLRKQFIPQVAPRYIFWFMLAMIVWSIIALTNLAVNYFQADWTPDTLYQAVVNTLENISMSMPAVAIIVALALTQLKEDAENGRT